MTRRTVIGAAVIALVLALGGGYVIWRGASAAEPVATGLDPARPGSYVYVEDGRVRQTGGEGPALVGPECQRAYYRAGVLSCLHALGPAFSAELVVYGADLSEKLRTPVWGNPSRTQVSPSGHLVAWTVFREGDDYMADGRFSTTAGLYDLRTGLHHGSLEDYTSYVDGARFTAADVNYWGITFAADDNTFYATMSAGGTTRLMRGDIAARTLTALRENVECPSLSPDGTRVAYKQRVGDRWRLHVLDLGGGADVALAETGHVDDQAAWADDRTVMYVKAHEGRPTVFTVPADGSGAPVMAFPGASPSPAG